MFAQEVWIRREVPDRISWPESGRGGAVASGSDADVEPVGADGARPNSVRRAQAFICTAHQVDPTFPRLVAQLLPIGRVYCHVDAKVSIEPFVAQLRGVDFLQNRVEVTYPTWSLMEAQLRLIRRALADGAERVTLLRSTHYPLVPPSVLDRLAEDRTDYLAAFPAPDPSRGKPPRRFANRVTTWPAFGSAGHRVVAGVRNRLAPPLDWTASLGGFPLRAGSAYWSLRRSTLLEAMVVLDRGGPLLQYFRQIESPDEVVLQTIVAAQQPALVPREISFSRWAGRQHPEPLDEASLDQVMASGSRWFAKKMTPALADFVDARLAAASEAALPS